MASLTDYKDPEELSRLERFLLGMFGAVHTPTWIWLVNLSSIAALAIILAANLFSILGPIVSVVGCLMMILVPIAVFSCLLTLIVDRKGRSLRETLVLMNLFILNVAPIVILFYLATHYLNA